MRNGQRKASLYKYKPEFFKYGFTESKERMARPYPSVFNASQVLANESMKENKLNCYLTSVHPNFVEKLLTYWENKEEQVKRSRIDAPSNSVAAAEKPPWRPLKRRGIL